MKVRFARLLAVVLLLSGMSFTAEAKVYLVSAGISDYPGENADLRLPANDATTIAWLYGKNSDVTYRLILNSQATVENIIGAISSLFSKARKNDIVVFFFSGHGYPGGFQAYDGPLGYDMVRKAMSGSRARNKMIFADACFSGDIRTPRRDTGSDMAAARKAQVMLFLSSRSDEVSLERADMTNGFFTAYLQRGLRGAADSDHNRTVTAKELFDYVHTRVALQSGNRQHPVMWGNFPDDMPVIKW